MEDERIDLVEKIERCRRLARSLTDVQMREALEDLADEYEAQLNSRNPPSRNEGFMLRDAR